MIQLNNEDQKTFAVFSAEVMRGKERKNKCVQLKMRSAEQLILIMMKQQKALATLVEHFDENLGVELPRASYFEWSSWNEVKAEAQDIMRGTDD